MVSNVTNACPFSFKVLARDMFVGLCCSRSVASTDLTLSIDTLSLILLMYIVCLGSLDILDEERGATCIRMNE